MASRAALAVPLLLQTPPGQLPNVYEDLSGLVGSEGDAAQADEDEFKKLSSRVREEHNLEQYIVVDLPNGKGKSILCPSAAHAGQSNRFLAPRDQVSFVVDHETLKTSDSKPYKPNASVEEFRSLLEKYISVYVADRYATGVADVFAVPLPRVQVPVKPETIEAAKEATEDLDPSEETGTVATGAGDKMESVEGEGETEEQHATIKEDQQMEGTDDDPEKEGAREETKTEAETDGEESKDKVMEEVHDDPVTTAETMEEVEESKKEIPSTATEEEKEEEDVETEGETKIVVHIVANRYKLSNFWSGRWRATYTLSSPSETDLEADVQIQIHYFEEGNVQLNSNNSQQLSISKESSDDAKAKAIVHAIEKFEASYQEELFSTCNELSEGAFKSLRRQLPMTKQKVDWDKVLNYKLGSELTE